jgi:ribose transport system ATP-binding protein
VLKGVVMIAPVLEAKGICKRFPGVQALNAVDLRLEVGEICAVIGENGAGKSTLMKIIGGIYQPDAGELFHNGTKVTVDSVESAIGFGIALIHQELNLADNLDVASNVFLGREPCLKGAWKPFRFVDLERLYSDTERILEDLGVDCDPRTLITHLPIGQQQMVEIAKAISVSARILVMDEPTSSLTKNEVEQLFKVMSDLRAKGVSIIYVSHRLGEVKRIADRVVVLRDGCNSGGLAKEEIDNDAMVKLMVGRSLDKFYHHVHRETRKHPVLEVRGLRTVSNPGHEIDFSLQAGEILGLAGLIGAGRTELLHALFGIEHALCGEVLIDGHRVHIQSPRDAILAGIGLVPEDRRLHGLILEMMVEENITLAGLEHYQKFKLIRHEQVVTAAKLMVGRFNIRTPSIFQETGLLSGGNQQKVVLAKWLLLKPRLLLLDEPTRGIDIVAKEEIYRFMEQLAAEGVGILMASSEMLEVLGISDRILTMHEGRLSGELSKEQFSEEAVAGLATGGR